MKIIIEIQDSEVHEAADFIGGLKKKDTNIQLTVGNFNQAEFKFKSITLEHTPAKAKPKASK